MENFKNIIRWTYEKKIIWNSNFISLYTNSIRTCLQLSVGSHIVHEVFSGMKSEFNCNQDVWPMNCQIFFNCFLLKKKNTLELLLFLQTLPRNGHFIFTQYLTLDSRKAVLLSYMNHALLFLTFTPNSFFPGSQGYFISHCQSPDHHHHSARYTLNRYLN